MKVHFQSCSEVLSLDCSNAFIDFEASEQFFSVNHDETIKTLRAKRRSQKIERVNSKQWDVKTFLIRCLLKNFLWHSTLVTYFQYFLCTRLEKKKIRKKTRDIPKKGISEIRQ